ncbi:bifunctional diguanylate cyclase/phosphodiesterase [Paenibacillus sp. 19GGS1-52]|uniref:bifunctional diguanylate cyclase/phosphodiesterase n=1 Tax=Paenibacillus sp. 19GGS1-52 TaxID=2758563 RepID=UPI001EFB9594|nr:EAL domain-containing protein [Paenibacillus sp. 19GGS1-52]ULO07830.1 bifunctional diguanylate cyclase/phosphodiesterase [Paenibacillus sp. 19GGS1-52]
MAFISKKPLTIILGFIVALQLSLFYYYSLSVDREYRAEQADLSAQAVMLTSNIEERVSIVKGVSAFIQAVGFDADPAVINQYLAAAYGNSSDIMNIMIAPDGLIHYVYPLAGNTAILNKSLFLDSTLSSPGLIQETLRSRKITVDGPRTLAQGDYGMVIRQALYNGDSFKGIVSVTMRIDDIVDFLLTSSEVYVTKVDHTFLFGNQNHNPEQQLTAPLEIYNQHWLMGVALNTHKKWEVLRSLLLIDLACLLIIAFILYILWHQNRFNRDLERIVSIRTRDLRISKRLYEKLAHYDSLTDIPNRRYFMEEFERLLQSAEPTQTYTLFFFDLNRFKEINDTLGHSIGDQVIKALAGRLANGNLPFTMFARTGGDEFIMLFEDIPPESIPDIAGKISVLISETLNIAGAQLNLSTSIGVSLYPEHSLDKDDLLKFADMSMYQAKSQEDADYFLFNWELREKLLQRTMISKYLHFALERNEFVLHYQPQINAITGEMIGMEALIRWNHPEKGLIGPGTFIAAVEEAGLMIQLTDWVLREVCRQLCAWRADGMTLLRTSINISNSWFYNRNLLENLFAVLDQYQLGTEVLEFEITESTALLEEHYPLLQQMRDRGIVVSIDDFGTKYSSLNYLKHFPVNKIKIDRTFITGIGVSTIDETIIKSIVYVASQLGYDLIAEGVETVEQADFLIQHNCPYIQGFLFYPGLPPAEIRKLVS